MTTPRACLLAAGLVLGGAVYGSGTLSTADWTRYSVLTPAGPDEPAPELFKKVKRLIYSEHKVAKGEYSAWHLAKKYGTTAMSLQVTKGDEMVFLYPGMKVVVHNKDGMLYEVKKATETLDQVVGRFHHLAAARVKAKTSRDYKELVVSANKLPGSAMLGDYELYRGAMVLLPGVQMSFDTYRFPFAETGWHRISSRFGSRFHPILRRRKFHDGLDLPKPWGTPVFPARSGRVIEAGWRDGYGLLIVIQPSDGATTRYGHLSKIHVKAGAVVQRGRTLIGRVGSSGLSTGPHLHFEVRDKSGRAVNPGTKIGRR